MFTDVKIINGTVCGIKIIKSGRHNDVCFRFDISCSKLSLSSIGIELHGPSMFAIMAKIYEVLYKQSSSIAFDKTSSYWSAPKN